MFMPTDIITIACGFVVGALIGLTGIGGGVVLLPLLIHGLGVPPIIAVGSSALYSSLTKVGAGWFHLRQKTVDGPLTLWLATGSVPGAFIGFALLQWIRSIVDPAQSIDDVLTRAIGLLLIVVPLVMWTTGLVSRRRLRSSDEPRSLSGEPRFLENRSGWFIAVCGFVGGFLVGFTSIGAGSVIMMLLILTTRRPPATLVGTDITHAVLLTGVTGILHFGAGNIDVPLIAWLLIGSLPGTLIGTRLAVRFPAGGLKALLSTLLIIVGITML